MFGALALAAFFTNLLAGTAAARTTEQFAQTCPAETLEEGATVKLNHNPAARHAIVPTGATSMRICRYYGFGELSKQTPKTQARAGKLHDQAVVNGRGLLESLTLEFKELLGAPKGPISCPADEGAELYAVFFYRDAKPVILHVSLSGCRFVSGATPRAREMTESLQNRLVRLAEGKHVKSKPGHSVKEHGAVAHPPPHLSFGRARHAAKGDLEEFCEESKLCQSWSIGRCSRKSVKAIGCRYLAKLLSGEECRGAIRVSELGEGMLSSSPGVQSTEEGECFYLFAPPGFKEEIEDERAHHRLQNGGASVAVASSGAQLTRGQIAREAGFLRDRSGSWLYEECVIDRIFPTRGEVLAARKREERRGLEGPSAVGLVVGAAGERFGVELGRNFVYCQEAVENALARVGHGGVPEGTPTTMANARQAIEALGFPIQLTEPKGEKGVLVGRVHGSLGERFAFFLFVNRSAPVHMKDVPGYPGFQGQNGHGGLLGGTLVDGYILGSRETPRKRETKRQFQQQSHIEIEVEEALCMQATGELCGI
jgi:hypothetical protein